MAHAALLSPYRRNQNYSDILHSLALGDKHLGGFDLTLRFTHLFWFGDLNYRLDMDVQVGPCGARLGTVWEEEPGGHCPFPGTGHPQPHRQEGFSSPPGC